MPELTLTRKDVPHLLSGNGKLSVNTGALRLGDPVPEDAGPIAARLSGAAAALGAEGTLVPVFPAAADSLEDTGLADFFADEENDDKFVLRFDTGAGYAYLRAFDRSLPLEEVLARFFDTMCLPEQTTRAPERGEAIIRRPMIVTAAGERPDWARVRIPGFFDALIDMSGPAGAALMAEAGCGDFERMLEAADGNLVQVLYSTRLTKPSPKREG